MDNIVWTYPWVIIFTISKTDIAFIFVKILLIVYLEECA